MKFVFSIAAYEDEPEIQKMISLCPMPGKLEITFKRNPDFFLGCQVSGLNYNVYIARNVENRN